mmetsp:Transcript_32745/g.64169  ORF Transcript_32745/g.64169 Transcript_32745/m.64169 type:complete len:241 (-) Transcript_32745:94-816(-)
MDKSATIVATSVTSVRTAPLRGKVMSATTVGRAATWHAIAPTIKLLLVTTAARTGTLLVTALRPRTPATKSATIVGRLATSQKSAQLLRIVVALGNLENAIHAERRVTSPETALRVPPLLLQPTAALVRSATTVAKSGTSPGNAVPELLQWATPATTVERWVTSPESAGILPAVEVQGREVPRLETSATTVASLATWQGTAGLAKEVLVVAGLLQVSATNVAAWVTNLFSALPKFNLLVK